MIDQGALGRRNLLKNVSLGGLGLAGGLILPVRSMLAGEAKRTPSQVEGPFYPVNDQLDKNADMTRVGGRFEPALGERISLSGQVIDGLTGEPITGALVEFWQACATGRYNHPRDTSEAKLDPNFQYWAQVRTGKKGQFEILTVKPGSYKATEDWIRPPHIHVKVHREGYPSLTTQFYFGGEPLNETDQILNSLSKEDQAMVMGQFYEGNIVAPWKIYLLPRGAFGRAGQSFKVTPEIV
jgi:protocatechuate 3,4-dioxygenase beta subunit